VGCIASRADFTDEEWARLGRAPVLAGVAISLSDPGGPIEALKESSAALKTAIQAANEKEFGPFVRSLSNDLAAKVGRRENPLAGFAADKRNARDQILDELRSVHALVADKGSPEDMEDFHEWIRTSSQQAALAAKEGGFLGIGAERVSDREQQMLETLGEIFGVPRSSPDA
jgi:hypothetical protein